jgi:hypothetical protein
MARIDNLKHQEFFAAASIMYTRRLMHLSYDSFLYSFAVPARTSSRIPFGN